ncbi:MAG: carbamoyl phosphate synthase small subunit [Clostridiales bacterium]
MKVILVLEDGTVFHGKSFGAVGEVLGEIVFNTGMTGYQEVMTDPSYSGQIVTMTYPLIGNYGINHEDNESKKPQVKGFIVRENCNFPSNWRSEETLDNFLKRHNIFGLYDIDTRSLTRILREKGTMRGLLTNKSDFNFEDRKNEILEYKIKNPVGEVTTKKVLHYSGIGKKIVLIDYGLKRNIVESLLKRGCDVYVVPSYSKYEDILKIKPDGIMLSNGPGDPVDCVEEIKVIRKLMGKIPIFGICLGHQLTALANGARSEKLKYGHRGCNHPVKDLDKNITYITSQNHGYTIVKDSLDKNKMEISHINMNDDTVEGINYKNTSVFTVQFHPEASPGPMDTAYLFDKFIDMINKMKNLNEVNLDNAKAQ